MKKTLKEQDGRMELKEQLVRALADYDNLKKRVEREREESDDRAKARIVARLLPVFDMFDRVQKHVNDSGLAMALGELGNQLREEGFSLIEPKVREQFSEETMEAIEVVDQEGAKPGEVVEVSLKGWKMGKQVLRYAKVVVSWPGDSKERKENV